MTIKYSDIVKKVRAEGKKKFIYAIVFVVISGVGLLVEFEGSKTVLVVDAVVCPAVIFAAYWVFMRVGKNLNEMWESIGITDKNEIPDILGGAECIHGDDPLLLMTDSMILNFHTLHAYRLTNIRSLYKRTQTDEYGKTVTGYSVEAFYVDRPNEWDVIIETDDEAVCEEIRRKIAKAYEKAGGTELIIDSK